MINMKQSFWNISLILMILTASSSALEAQEDNIGTLKEAEDFVEIILRGVEKSFKESFLPYYQQIRADPFMSKVMVALVAFVLFNTLVCNIFSCLCNCGCAKVIRLIDLVEKQGWERGF